ncbi:MAG TPA: phospholipase [Solirubrobacteraceae bacterium]|nr:phospholipase [Solirubrobacteraceae bacterium]
MTLSYAERPAAGNADGLLVLHHGRGTDEQDLMRLADFLDPARRLHVVGPRAPLTVPGSPGHHWYLVPRVGYPDPETFAAARAALAELHDELWERTGIAPAQTVLGGFSMGCVISYATGLDAERPRPAGILAFSGFIPTVPGWEPDLADRVGLPVLVAHGRQDPVISVEFARAAVTRLKEGGLDVDYREFDGGHWIDPYDIERAQPWLTATLPPGRAAAS